MEYNKFKTSTEEDKNFRPAYRTESTPESKPEISPEVKSTILESEEETMDSLDKIVKELEKEEVKESVKPESEDLVGFVSTDGNFRLNLREEAHSTSKILDTLEKDEEVMVSKKDIYGDFYLVTTANGQEGYCMKKFITLV